MAYVKDPEWTVCGTYMESLEEKITDDIIDKLDRISFESFVSFSCGIENLRCLLHSLSSVEEQLFFWSNYF